MLLSCYCREKIYAVFLRGTLYCLLSLSTTLCILLAGSFKFKWAIPLINASVIRQKGESQNECFKKTKHTKIFEKWTFFTPIYAHVVLFENLACFVFLKNPFSDSLFCLITDDLRVKIFIHYQVLESRVFKLDKSGLLHKHLLECSSNVSVSFYFLKDQQFKNHQ